MRDIFRTLKAGSDALREMGLDQAADQMIITAEQSLASCEDWLNSHLRYVLDEAEAAIKSQMCREQGRDEPRRAVRTLDLEEILTAASTPWYGETYQDSSEDTVTYLPDFITGATVRKLDDARSLRTRKMFTVGGKLKKGAY